MFESLCELHHSAVQLLRARRCDLAEKMLRRVVAQEPANPRALADLAWAVLWQSRPAEAVTFAQSAIQADPGVGFAHDVLARAMSQLGDYTRALEAASTAINLEPGNASYLATAATASYQLKRFGDARQFAEAGLKMEPEHIDCLGYLALAHARSGQMGKASVLTDGLLRREAGNPFVHWVAGQVYFWTENDRGAVQHLALALARDPHSAELHEALGVALSRLGDVVRSRRHLREALRINPTLAAAQEWIERLNKRAVARGKKFYPPPPGPRPTGL